MLLTWVACSFATFPLIWRTVIFTSRPYLTWAETVVQVPFEDAGSNRERREKLRDPFDWRNKGRFKLLDEVTMHLRNGLA